MTPRRLSRRTSAVKKRHQLEEKLKKRRIDAVFRLEIAQERSRSKALHKLHAQELRLFTEEALRLSHIAERFELNPNSIADNVSQESLEWDNSEELPSFLTATVNHSTRAAQGLGSICN